MTETPENKTPDSNEPKPRPKRKTKPAEGTERVLNVIAKFIKSMGNPQDIKSSLALFVAIAATAWTIFGLSGRVDSLEPRVDRAAQRTTTNDRRLDLQERRLDQQDAEIDALELSRRELNTAIAQAVERGIRRGVREALEHTK